MTVTDAELDMREHIYLLSLSESLAETLREKRRAAVFFCDFSVLRLCLKTQQCLTNVR